MFLPSQLFEISQRFRRDVEDLQVLLDEEGLPVGSAECLEDLSNRLGSDPRFRRDVAFLLTAMLGRERDEAGSMEVLGVLVVAAAGTRQEFDTPSRQRLIRELLRFIIQQRRPEAAAAATPATAVASERLPATAAPISSGHPTRREPPSPVPSIIVADPSAVVPKPVAVPLFSRAELEPPSKLPHGGWFGAVLALLLVLGIGLRMHHSGSKPKTPEVPALAAAPSASSRTYPAAPQPERRVILPKFPKSTHSSRKPSPLVQDATRRRAQQPQASAPVAVVANTRPKIVVRPEPLQPGPELNEFVSSSTLQPLLPHREVGAVSLPADAARQRSTPGSTDVSKVFAHPEAATVAVAQLPPTPFHPKDPVLIPRNKAAAFTDRPELQGTVHTGSAGNMASNLMYSPDPEYPAEAIAAGVQGEVTVRTVVGPRGNVIDASVVSGPPLLREAALDAVGHWRYRPYEQDGKPFAVATTAIFDFQIPSGN